MITEKLYILDESDLYKIIGVSENSDVDTINKSYRSLAKQYHPDIISGKSDEEKQKLNQIFSRITSAYNVLKDPDKRKSYDYERRLKLEYEKTLQQTQAFSNSNTVSVRPKSGGPTINITITPNAPNKPNVNKNKPGTAPKKEENQEQKGKASQETLDKQTEALFNSAMSKYSSGNIDAAILDLQTAIVINDQIAKYHSCLGLFMTKKGWQAYAKSHFEKALKIDPKDKLAVKYYLNPRLEDEKEREEKVTQKSFITLLVEFIQKFFKKNK